MRKVIKYFIIALCCSILVVGTSFFLIYNLYGDKLIHYTIEQLNQKLKVRAEVEKVNLDLFSNFPYAAVNFNNISITTHEFQHDTILKAKKISFQFNWIKILKSQFDFEGISISEGRIYLPFDNEGKLKYNIISNESGSSINENKISFSKINVKKTRIYAEFGSSDKLGIDILSLRFKGQISNIQISGNLYMQAKNLILNLNSRKFIVDNISTNTKFDYQNNLVNADGKIEVNKQRFKLTYIKGRETQKINLMGTEIYGKNLKKLLPDEIFSSLPEPVFDLNLNILHFLNTKKVKINSNLSLKNNELKLRNNLSASISGRLNYEGNYPENSHLVKAEETYIQTGLSRLQTNGFLKYKNNTWDFEVMGTCNLKLNEIDQIIDSLPFKSKNGELNFTYYLKKRTTNFKELSILHNYAFSTKVLAKNLSIEYSNMTIDSIHGDFTATNYNIIINNLSGNWNHDYFTLGGNIKWNEITNIDGRIHFENLNIDKLLGLTETNQSSNKKYRYRIELDAKNGSYKNISFSNLKTIIYSSDSALIIENLTATIFNGLIESINYRQISNENSLSGKFKSLDINLLNNFAEDNNISIFKGSRIDGKISGSVDIKWMTENDKIMYDRIMGESKVTITQGRLSNYSVFKDIIKYINLRNPEDVKFKTIHLQLNIKDNNIWIEQTDIKSSAIDFEAWGRHSFDNSYEYHFKFYLSDILKRQPNEKSPNIPVTEVEDSTRKAVVYVLLSGKDKSYKVAFDSKASINNFRDQWKKEQKNIRMILKEELRTEKTQLEKEKEITGNKKGLPRVIMEENENINKNAPPAKSKKQVNIEWKDDDN